MTLYTDPKECHNDGAHIRHAQLRKKYVSWLSTQPRTKDPDLLRYLTYFAVMGRGDIKARPVNEKCKPFLLLVARTLSETNDEFRVLYNNYWDTWGCIAGELLKKETTTEPEIANAMTVLHTVRQRFTDNEWLHRQLATKGFKTFVTHSEGYEDVILKIFEYFLAYGNAACSGISGELPMDLCTYLSYLTESYSELAKQVAGKKAGSGYESLRAPDIIRSAEVLIELMLRADGSPGFGFGASSSHWREAIFEWMFPVAGTNITSGQPVKSTLENLINKLRCLRGEYPNRTDILSNYQTDCEEIYKRIIQGEWHVWVRLKKWIANLS